MTPEKYKLAGELFHRVRHLPAPDRETVLAIECNGDEELRDEVISLLEGDEEAGEGFLQNPAIEDAARLLEISPAEEIAIPKVLAGRYRIGNRIGAGGMGVVYEGEDLRLQRRVAIKILPASITARTGELLMRFQREARAASQLNHPNIAAVYDSGSEAGLSFLVMEFVEGRTLRSMLVEGRPADPKSVLDVVSQTASALRAAHEAGIIHRDIKPENIMLRPDGFVKVVDFGLARMGDGKSGEGNATMLTRAGQVAGTMQYFSPEQVLGSKVTPQSDIFSLGVVAYELASGVRPFDGPTDGAVFDAILHRDPLPPSAVRPQLGTALDGLIMGAIERDPDLRFQTAAELRGACKRSERLLATAANAPAQAYATRSFSKPRAWGSKYWMAATAALTVISAALFLTRPLPEPRVTGNYPITTGGRVTAFVNDGTWLYYSAGNAGSNTSFFVTSAKGGSARELVNFRGMAPLDISSDHSEVLLAETNKGGPFPLWVGPILGSQPHRLSDLRAFDAHWSSRGDKVVYTTGRELHVANSDGSGGRILFDRIGANGRVNGASFFDDDRRIRFHTAQDNVEKIWDINPDGSGLRLVLPDWNDAVLQTSPAIAKNGLYSVFAAGTNGIDWDLWMLPESSGLLSFRRPRPIRLTVGPITVARPQFTPDSRRIFYVGDSDQTQLVRYDARSGEWTPYLGGMSAFQLDFSRDGEWVTYVAHPGHSVWCSRKDGSQATQVTLPPLTATNPRFSPDRSKIVFFGYQPGRRTGMYLVSPSGGPVEALVPKGKSIGGEDPNWSPDSLNIIYSAERSLWGIDLATRDAKKLPGSDGLRYPRWSPDGKYAVATDEQSHLWLYGLSDHSRVLLTTVGSDFPMWSRDSKYVYFENADFSAWYRTSIEGHRVEQIASLTGLHISFASMGWVGMTPEGSVISSRDVSTRNIYAIEWEIR